MTTGALAGAAPIASDRVGPMGRDRLVIVLAYVVAWGALLVNRGFYWDDWTLVGVPSESVIRAFSELGMPWIGYFFTGLFATPLPGLAGHAIVFGAYLTATLILHAILCRVPGLRRMDAFVAALTFAVLPVNYARIAVIDIPYGLSLLAFLAATWLMIRSLEDGGLGRRLAALVLFAVSFTTASLLVLYVVPIALAIWIVWKAGTVPLRSFALRHLDFLALPILYWVLKGALLAPTGAYEGYNALTVRGLSQVPRLMLLVPSDVLVEPLVRAVEVAGLLGILVGAAMAFWLMRRSRDLETDDPVPAPVLAIVGVAVVALGVVAYLAVGREPTIWDWSSRHQLLVPIGVGLLAAAAVRPIRGHGPVGAALGLSVGMLLGISVVADARTLVAYQADWFKQVALMESARAIPEVRTSRRITVADTATELDALRRTYRFYEYNALFSQVLGDTRRLISDGVNEPAEDEIQTFIDRPAYHMGEFVPSPIDLRLDVSLGKVPDLAETLRLIALEATGSPDFGPAASQLIGVRATPVAP